MLDDASIHVPYETYGHLFHGQTEENNGDRTSQREAWPTPKHGSMLKLRYQVMGKSEKSDMDLVETAFGNGE